MAPRDLIVAVFGDAGKHARAAVGAGSLPRGVAVEVDGVFEIAVTVRLARRRGGIGAAALECAAPIRKAAADPHPFTRFEFFAALEAVRLGLAPRTGWQPAHLVLEEDGAVHGILPAYLKSHSQGEYVFDHAWADALERAGGDYYPKLQCSVPFTPVTGPAHPGPRRQGTRALLLKAGKAATRPDRRLVAAHHLPDQGGMGRRPARQDYLLRTDQQFHWRQSRLSRLRRSFWANSPPPSARTCAKSARRCAKPASRFDWLTGRDITEAHWDRFFEFYMDTGSRKWGHPYLTRDSSSAASAPAWRDQIVLMMAKRGGHYIAGALNLFGEGMLFGRNWGAVEYVPFLHFETCYYQAIDFAIARGLIQRSKPAPRASTNCCAAICRRRPIAPIISPIRACAARWISSWSRNAKR